MLSFYGLKLRLLSQMEVSNMKLPEKESMSGVILNALLLGNSIYNTNQDTVLTYAINILIIDFNIPILSEYEDDCIKYSIDWDFVDYQDLNIKDQYEI